MDLALASGTLPAQPHGRGVEVATGGAETVDPESGKGWFYRPTIVDDRAPDDSLAWEEIFGPLREPVGQGGKR